jgi:hypothetical protein
MDSLGTQCSGCGHSNNWHQPGDLCLVKVKQGSDERCGCTYVSPHAEPVLTVTRPSLSDHPGEPCNEACDERGGADRG